MDIWKSLKIEESGYYGLIFPRAPKEGFFFLKSFLTEGSDLPCYGWGFSDSAYT